MARLHPAIAIVNKSTVLTDAELHMMVVAAQYQITYHWEPQWNSGATLLEMKEVPAGAWGLIIADTSDQAGALGYHETTAAGLPLGFVFAKDDMKYGNSVSITLSHELLEMLGDPFASEAVQIGTTTFAAYESCDAVEADELGYKVKGISMSDFIYPQWFIPGIEGPFDHGNHCKAPLTILPGGYCGIWTPKQGWQQTVNNKKGKMNRHPAQDGQAGWRWKKRTGHDETIRGYVTFAD